MTERDLARAREAGAESLRQVMEATGLGQSCETCLEYVAGLLEGETSSAQVA
ncbi:MAG: (2Fe-2S)-binding protein [Spirochaetales bacterium]|nr:(2Fe-2S)-binding protein [Leptospiraceae bacterium]MCP5482042.1 (2Fe-2S)-binding protein [Spirochaetales bacterium]MCP5486523.1 (2Fe-2S)-binding protein [Spirochaetales bacterium]